MSSQAKRVKDSIVGQRIATVCDVLSIMQNEADKMSRWQRRKLARQFVKTGNIDSFFQLSKQNRDKEQESDKKDV